MAFRASMQVPPRTVADQEFYSPNPVDYESGSATIDKNRSAVQRVVSLIQRRYYEPLTLQDLAAEACYSTFHFTRVFHKEAGLPPRQFLTAVRLYHAKRLLAGTDMSIVDVVTSVGYSSVGTFTTRFTNATGVSPSAFRDPAVNRLLALVGPCGLQLPSAATVAAAECRDRRYAERTGAIAGSLELPDRAELLVGVFDSTRRRPARWPATPSPPPARSRSTCRTSRSGCGTWWRSAGAGMSPTDRDAALLATTERPIRVSEGEVAGAPALRLAPPTPLAPPIATLFGPPPRDRLPAIDGARAVG